MEGLQLASSIWADPTGFSYVQCAGNEVGDGTEEERWVAAADVPPVNGAAINAPTVGIKAPPISYFKEPFLSSSITAK